MIRAKHFFSIITLVDEANSPGIIRLDELNEGLNGSLPETQLGIDFLFLAANGRV